MARARDLQTLIDTVEPVALGAQHAGEERVPLRRVHDRAGAGLGERDFALGAVRALAWILGCTGSVVTVRVRGGLSGCRGGMRGRNRYHPTQGSVAGGPRGRVVF
ncbi:hypothetical protein GCM10010495_81070 [Kitasatospora herbaricolor]|nr:hypothetical protein [Kitasatospora herbaricolor]GGV51187.1 hypothetical protein GCM10010495_81070 [Kitasatospora herbaricolor]